MMMSNTQVTTRIGGIEGTIRTRQKRIKNNTGTRTHARAGIRRQALASPHSGYHADRLPRRFFEGWYFKVALEDGDAFAFMFSVEDPALPWSPDRGVGAQVMGPRETYLCQFDKQTSNFRGDPRRLALSHVFEFTGTCSDEFKRSVLHETFSNTSESVNDFFENVKSGFVVTAQGDFCGRLRSPITRAIDVNNDTGVNRNGDGYSSTYEEECKWCLSFKPSVAYGGTTTETQRSTGGWLSTIPIVFDPHWQILISDGTVTCDGYIEWRGRRYTLNTSHKVYAEKNWGGSFPKKWFWVQCNSGWQQASSMYNEKEINKNNNNNDDDVMTTDSDLPKIALTAGGGLRDLPLTSTTEQVALITVHMDGEMYEFVPWLGSVSWDISEWGEWTMEAACETKVSSSNRTLRAKLVATTSDEGVVLCAPSANGGLRPLCRDSFKGFVHLSIYDTTNGGETLLNVTSRSAALEVGGGPWFGEWKAKSNMNFALKRLLNIPLPQSSEEVVGVPTFLLPPGL